MQCAEWYWIGVICAVFVIMLIGLRPDTDGYR